MSSDGESIGCRIFTTLTSNSQCHLSLVRECQSLEDKIGCQGITQDVLDGAYTSMRSLSKFLAEVDWQKSLSDARNHHSTSVAAEIATFTSWLKLWDTALDYGPLGTASLQGLYRELTRPSFGSKPCHLCDINHLRGSYFNPFISSHSSIDISSVSIIQQLKEADPGVFSHAKLFHRNI